MNNECVYRVNKWIMTPTRAWSFHSIHPQQPAHNLVNFFRYNKTERNFRVSQSQKCKSCIMLRSMMREWERSHSKRFASVRAITEHLTDPHFRPATVREKLQYGFTTPAQMRRTGNLLHRTRRRRQQWHHSRTRDVGDSASVSIAQASRAGDPAWAAR